MRTIVYQSFRTRDVPAWMETCMGTVRAWAAGCGFDYRFLDDRLFDEVPDWFRARAGGEICPVTDLARLQVARRLLAEGYDLTIWVDADMLVFAPERLQIPIDQGFAFCREIWVGRDRDGEPAADMRVNNSVTVFARGNHHLEFFIDACLRRARHLPRMGKLDASTAFLSQLRQILPFALLENVGMASPALMVDILTGGDRFLRAYARKRRAPLACANLCGSLSGGVFNGTTLDSRAYEAVIEACLRSRGDVFEPAFDASLEAPGR